MRGSARKYDVRMAQFVLKIEKLSHTMGPRASQDLRSPSLIMPPDNTVNLYRGISKLKLKINVNVPQLLCIVVSVALNGEFERFGEFCVDCY